MGKQENDCMLSQKKAVNVRLSRYIPIKALKKLLWIEFKRFKEEDHHCVMLQEMFTLMLKKNAYSSQYDNILANLSFICLLHVASENCLNIQGSSGLNCLYISNDSK